MVNFILKAAIVAWAVGSITTISAHTYLTKDLHTTRAGLERAVVEEFKGTQPLDEILKSQEFQTITYDDNGGIVAFVNAQLANACGTPQFAQNPVCERYGEIPRQLEEKAAARAKYDWFYNVGLGLEAAIIHGILIFSYVLYRERKREERQQAQNLISP